MPAYSRFSGHVDNLSHYIGVAFLRSSALHFRLIKPIRRERCENGVFVNKAAP
jgi:hypothetical protein